MWHGMRDRVKGRIGKYDKLKNSEQAGPVGGGITLLLSGDGDAITYLQAISKVIGALYAVNRNAISLRYTGEGIPPSHCMIDVVVGAGTLWYP